MRELKEIIDLVSSKQIINEYGIQEIRLRCFIYCDYVLVKNTNFNIYPEKQLGHVHFDYSIKGFENGVWYFSYFLLISGKQLDNLRTLIIDKFGDIIDEPEFRQTFDDSIILQVSFDKKVNKIRYF